MRFYGYNPSSKTLKCHISLIIYCKTHVCHVPSVVNDLCSQIYTPLSTRQHMMAANDSVAKVIASFYRDDLGIVFLGLSYYFRPSIIPANFFLGFHLVITRVSRNVPATSADFRRLSEDFRTLPKMSANVPKTFEHFQSYFRDDNFSVL